MNMFLRFDGDRYITSGEATKEFDRRVQALAKARQELFNLFADVGDPSLVPTYPTENEKK